MTAMNSCTFIFVHGLSGWGSYGARQDPGGYPQQDVDGTYPMANKDFHTMYVGEIVDAYVIRET